MTEAANDGLWAHASHSPWGDAGHTGAGYGLAAGGLPHGATASPFVEADLQASPFAEEAANPFAEYANRAAESANPFAAASPQSWSLSELPANTASPFGPSLRADAA